MFGQSSGSGFGGFGSNNQSNTTGNTGSVFGSGGGFGQQNSTGTGFGNTGNAFGSNTSNAFGSTGNTGTPFGGGSGGGFGSNTTTSAFGAPKSTFGSPSTTGGGLFGSNNTGNTNATSGFGGFGGGGNATSTFGSNTNSSGGGGLFGAAKPFGSTTTSAPTSGGLFGTAGATSGGFGGSNPTFGAGNQPPSQGTANPPYQATQEKETAGAGGTTNHYQTISFMPAYKGFSLEELRLQDYAQGRRYGTESGQSGAFGFNTGFGTGASNNTSTGGGFGNTNTGGGLFGNSNTNAQPAAGGFASGFGNNASSTSGQSLFGKPAAPSTGLFGNTNTTTPSTGTSLFGTGTNATTNAFGSTNTSGFGTNAAASGTTGSSLFGNNQNQTKSPFSFNTTTTPAAGGGFASGAGGFGNTSTNVSGGGLFSNNNQQNAGGFGAQNQTSGTGFGSGSGFGSSNQQPSNTNAFGTFANNQNQQQSKPFGGGFNTTPAQPAAGGLFNNAATNQNSNSGGLFANKPAFGTTPSSQPGGGLFGSTPNAASSGTSLFGNQQNSTSTGGGLFNSQPNNANTGGGLFSSQQNKPGGLFATSTQNANSGGLFNNSTQAAPGNSLFNTPSQQSQQGPGLFNSPFNTSLQGSQMQQPQPSIHDSPFNSPFVNSTLASQQGSPLGPIATPLGSSQTKKAAMIPHHKIAPRQPSLTPRLSSSFSRSGSPFASSSSGNTPLSGSLGRSFSTSKLNLFDSDDSVLSSGAFTPNGSSRVASLKKLVIDKKLRDHDLFSNGADARSSVDSQGDRGSATRGILKKTVSFDIGSNARNEELFGTGETPVKETAGAAPTAEELGYIRSTPERRRTRDADISSNGAASATRADGEATAGNELAIVQQPKEDKSQGSYWMVPSAQKLKSQPKEQLKRVIGLTIGRRGFGQVRFDNPVDLTAVPVDLEDIPGTVVTFDERVCTVYPEGLQKPPPGKGLNVPATITLEDCFPVTKNERGKIRDPEHPRYVTHIRRLKSIKETEFVDYLANEGIWIFRVKHFTTYGLTESDEEEEELYNDSSLLSSIQSDSTPTARGVLDTPLSHADEDNESMDADVSGMDTTLGFDDTFDFKRMGSSAMGFAGSRSGLPGSFLGSEGIEASDESMGAFGESTMEEQSFLGEGSVGSVDVDEPTEPMSESELVDESTIMIADETIDEDNEGTVIEESDVTANLIGMTPLKSSPVKMTKDTPRALPLGRDWTEQLNNTISPVKRRFGGEGFVLNNNTMSESPVKRSVIEPINYGLLDLANDLYGNPTSINGSARNLGKTRKRDQYESPVMAKYRPESIRPATKMSILESPTKPFDYERLENKDQAWRKAIRPCWGRDGTLIYRGDLEGVARSVRKSEALEITNFKYGIENHTLPKTLELQLRGTSIQLDERKVPVAVLDLNMVFQRFVELPWSEEPQDQHEKCIWHLASVLWDPIIDPLLPLQGRSAHQREYVIEKYRKEGLSKFLKLLVETDADQHIQAASTLEEAAFAHLSAYRVEQACAALIEAGDYRLANLLSMVGGGGDTVRQNTEKQLQSWRQKGVLSEIPIDIRALYELIAGQTCFSEGTSGPPEDTTPDFYISEHFKLDWKRSLALKVWYGTFEDEGIAKAVAKYLDDLTQHPDKVPEPTLEQCLPNGGARLTSDPLWGLLQLYADKDMKLEDVLSSRCTMSTSLDYRLVWQFHTILAKRGIRGFSGDIASTNDNGEAELLGGSKSAEITMSFAGELETAGLWEWAIFIVMHLVQSESREAAIRNILGRHVDEVEMDEASGGKLTFLDKTLLIPKQWIYEAKALQKRNDGEHLLEAEYLLAAKCWDEAHQTIIQRVAPEAVIAGDLDELIKILGKFEDVANVEKWNVGGQVYLDYVRLLDIMRSGSGRRRSSLGGSSSEPKGLPKGNSVKEVARRLLASLKSVERKEFLQNVAVREMSGVVSTFVLNNPETVNDQARVLQLPLSEDQYLRETMRLSVSYLSARLQTV